MSDAHNTAHSPPHEALADVIRGDVSIGTALGFTGVELEKLVALGNAHLRAGRVDDARAVFDGLTALEPRVAAFHHLAGMAAEAAGDLDGADVSFTAALHCGVDDGRERARGNAYLSRALVRMKQERNGDALADFALAGALCDPNDAVFQQTLRVMGGRCGELVARATTTNQKDGA